MIALTSLEWTEIAEANLENTLIKVKKYFIPPLFWNTLHIGKIGLLLGIDSRHIGVVLGKPTARQLVQRIGFLAL